MRSIIQHLRFPFSYLLLPVFLLSYATVFHFTEINYFDIFLLFFILHVLVYPSSNAYNSVQDRDETSIGLVENPLPIHRNLEWTSALFDIVAVGLACIISFQTAVFILTYILVSRLYSYRKIRLKKYPIIGFLVVFIFQGAWIFYTVTSSLGDRFTDSLEHYHLIAVASSCLIGAIYPLSQIYQHNSDKADGVITISYLLGKRGTFIFSGVLFLVGSIVLLLNAYQSGEYKFIGLYLAFQLPSLIYFNYWFYKVIKDESEANFKHTMRMSLISATCMNAFFIFLILY
jgi:1,4-dihydroxy-2-naphthoate octaprenyltransferase